MSRAFVFTVLLGAMACGPLPPHEYGSGIRYDLSCPCLPKRQSSGLAFNPDYMWPVTPINVCFDNGTTEQQQWVQDAMSKTWGLASRLRFTWDGCLGGRQEVHVRFASTFDIDGIGVQLNHLSPGLTLGTFRNDERDLRMQAVFGFGFVMGFTAAQDRADSQCGRAQRFGAFAVRTLGPWDDKTTMNECKAPTYNWGLLSDGDIAGAQRVYGERDTCECPEMD